MKQAIKKILPSYVIAAKAVLAGYRRFAWSFGAVTFLFLAIGALAAVPPYFIKLAANELGLQEGRAIVALAGVVAFAAAWTFSNVLENIKGAFSAAVLCRADAALHASALKSLLSKSYKEQAANAPTTASEAPQKASITRALHSPRHLHQKTP